MAHCTLLAAAREFPKIPTPLAPDNAIRAESRQIASMPIDMEEKNPEREEKNVPAEKLDNDGTQQNKELSDPVIEFAAVSTPITEGAGRENLTAHLGQDGVVVQETNVCLDYNLTASMTQASNNYMSPPQDTQAISTSPSRRNTHGEKLKENPTTKMKYVTRKGLNKISAPPTEVTGQLTKEMMPESAKTCCTMYLNFDIEAKVESSAGRENATAHLSKEIGVITQEMNVGLAHDLNTSVKQASNKCMPLPEETQAPSKSVPHKTKPKEKPTAKRKYVRWKRLNKTSTPPAEMTEKMTEPVMPKSNKMTCRRFLNVGIGARDESSAGRENVNVHISKEMVVEETEVSLAYDLSTSMNQALNNYISLPEDTQAPSTSPSKSNIPGAKPEEKPTGKRKQVRRKKLKISTPPTETTGDLTKPMMPEPTKISYRMPLNLDKGARDESSACRENIDMHISNEHNVVVDIMHVGGGPVYDQSPSMKQAVALSNTLAEDMPAAEDTEAPSISPSQSSPPGAKLNANAVENKKKRNGRATAHNGNENNAKVRIKSVAPSNANDSNIIDSQISAMRPEMVGSKRKHSDSVGHPNTGNIGDTETLTFEEFVSQLRQIKCDALVAEKRAFRSERSEKEKSSNTHITSSMTITKDVQLTCPQNAQAHLNASGSSHRISGSEYCAAIVPATESDIGDTETQTFEKFVSQLRWLVCDGLAAEKRESCLKKRRNRRGSAREIMWRIRQYDDALGEEFRQLNMNTEATMQRVDALGEEYRQLNMKREARNLALHEQKAICSL